MCSFATANRDSILFAETSRVSRGSNDADAVELLAARATLRARRSTRSRLSTSRQRTAGRSTVRVAEGLDRVVVGSVRDEHAMDAVIARTDCSARRPVSRPQAPATAHRTRPDCVTRAPGLRLSSTPFPSKKDVDLSPKVPLQNVHGAPGRSAGCECWSQGSAVPSVRTRLPREGAPAPPHARDRPCTRGDRPRTRGDWPYTRGDRARPPGIGRVRAGIGRAPRENGPFIEGSRAPPRPSSDPQKKFVNDLEAFQKLVRGGFPKSRSARQLSVRTTTAQGAPPAASSRHETRTSNG